jgi:putative methyltransferase (TIGR04325 family)
VRRSQLREEVDFLPSWLSAARALYEFASTFHSNFRGIYDTMDQARAAAPRSKPLGYDNSQAARMYSDAILVRPGDYPTVLWLGKALTECSQVFDIGGNIGISFYAYQKYLSYPRNLRWIVYDVPAVIEAGNEFAKERPSSGLTFTASLEQCPGSDIILAAGSLQYIDWNLSEMLAKFVKQPRHLLISRTPFYQGPSYCTLQNIGPSVCPYRIFNRDEFVQSIRGLRYELVDRWSAPDLSCRVPFHPSRTVHSYSGLYFRTIQT